MEQNNQSIIVKALQNPVTVFIGMGIGGAIGFFYPQAGQRMEVVGQMYIVLLQMTVIPLLVSAIVSSVSSFIQSPSLRGYGFYTFIVFFLFMIAYVLISLFFGLINRPGVIPLEKTRTLAEYIGGQVDVITVNLREGAALVRGDGGLLQSLVSLIPDNVFRALVEGKTLAITIVAILIGVSAGLVQKSKTQEGDKASDNTFIAFFDSVFEIFQSIIRWVLTILPIGIIFIVAHQVASFGFDIVNAVLRLIVAFYILGIILTLANVFVASALSKKSPIAIIKATTYPWIVGFTTKNSISAIFPSIQSLHKNLGVSRLHAKLLTPLAMVLVRYGNLAYFSLVAVFSSQLYNITLSGAEYIVLIFGLLFASFATAGASGFATLGVISIAFSPVGLPVETIMLILFAIDPIVDPMRTSLIVHTNVSAVAVVTSRLARDEKERVIPTTTSVERSNSI